MQQARAVDQPSVNLVRAQAHIRAGFARKAEGPLPFAVDRDESERSKHVGIGHNSGGGYAGPRERRDQQAAECIVANLGNQAGAQAAGGNRRQYVGGRAAGIGLQQRIARRIRVPAGKIDQQFADGHDVAGGRARRRFRPGHRPSNAASRTSIS